VPVKQNKGPGNQDIREGHQINDPRIYSFGNFFTSLFDNGPAHGALGKRLTGNKKTGEYDDFFIHEALLSALIEKVQTHFARQN
jgi:hypothetical protein